MHECPKCGTPMEKQEDDPDVGIVGGWTCDCGHTETLEDDDHYLDDCSREDS